jgi:penicillin V acylase-like amidase (Ntn superfamily)
MCTRVVWNTEHSNVYLGRNMDWFQDIQTNLWTQPRGLKRSGMTAENPLQWTSKYGSLIATAYEIATADGINDAGLVACMLYLPETSVSPRDVTIPGLSISMWAQYFLDMCGSVAEAVEHSNAGLFQLRMVEESQSGKMGTVHLALSDKSGDSAIIECIEGDIRIYHDRRHIVMTNQPTFDKQLENLRQYRGFGGEKRLPGTHEPADRFVRAAYYVTHLPEPKSEREAVAALMSVMRNAAAPFGISDPERPNVSMTVWRAIYNITDGRLFFDSVMSPSVFWIQRDQLQLEEGAPVMRLQVAGEYELANDVSASFVPAEMFTFLPSLAERGA